VLREIDVLAGSFYLESYHFPGLNFWEYLILVRLK